MNLTAHDLPNSVRYVKNGEGGKWWRAAKLHNQIHLGWRIIPHELLRRVDMNAIEPLIRAEFAEKRKATQDINALRTLLDRPSQHVWITFEDGCMWWCTVRDGITPNLDGNMSQHGHFWLTCELPWNNRSLDGERHLWIAELPGNITATAGFQGTVCEPGASTDILRVIRNQKHPNAKILDEARKEYERQVSKLIADLRHKDFEDLIDQILLKTGWTRLGKLGGVTEGIDLEVQNQISSEIAFVQVKGSATQAILDNYIQRFSERRSRYKRMIFAVHSPKGTLTVSEKLPVHVWTGQKLAEMVVDLGLVNFVMTRTN